MPETLVFPPHQGLPFDYRVPHIDGFAEWELGLPVVPGDEIETGWTGAARLTYGGASGLPPMSFQGLRDASQPFIYLSFVVRLDVAWDDKDSIILVLQPTFSNAAHPAGTRRLIIRPIHSPDGAGVLTNDGAPSVDQEVPIPPIPPPPQLPSKVKVRANHPVNLTWSQWTGAGWGAAAAPTNFEIRSRSWEFGPNDRNWSVEIKVPTTTDPASGGATWINLASAGFGFYFNVLRFTTPGNAVTSAFATEFIWPRANPPFDDNSGGPFANLNDLPVTPNLMGQGQLTGTGKGVYFDGGWGSIGVLDPGGSGSVLGTIDAHLGAANTMIAKLKNDGASAANGITGEFRLANFGIPGPFPTADWAKIDPHTPGVTNPTSAPGVNVAANGSGQITMVWTIDANDRTKYAGHGDDQCMLALLRSDQPVDFRESSYRRNLTFDGLSETDKDIVVSGSGYDAPPDGGASHDFLIVTTQRLLSSTTTYDGYTPAQQAGPLGAEPPAGAGAAGEPLAAGTPDPIALLRQVQRLLNIPDSAFTDLRFLNFVRAVLASGFLDDLAKMKEVTAFAPNYPALTKTLPAPIWDRLVSDKALMRRFLNYHVIPRRLTFDQLISLSDGNRLPGYQLQFRGDFLTIDDRRIIQHDVDFQGALVHVIDGVLLPSDLLNPGATAPWVAGEIFNGWQGTTKTNYAWISITSAYRRRGGTLTLGGTAYPLYEPADSCCVVLRHEGDVSAFNHTMTGQGLQNVGNGVYRLPVPHNGEAVLKVKYEAVDLNKRPGCPLGLLAFVLNAFGVRF